LIWNCRVFKVFTVPVYLLCSVFRRFEVIPSFDCFYVTVRQLPIVDVYLYIDASRLKERTYLAIVTILAEKTRRRDIILMTLNTFKAIKTTPEGRDGRNGLMSGISTCEDWVRRAIVKLGEGGV